MRLPKNLPSALISQQAENLLNGWLTSFNRSPATISQYLCMIREDRISRLCVLARKLTVLLQVGEYTHEDENIQNEVRDAIAYMDGSLNDKLASILNFDVFGYSFTEKAYAVRGGMATFSTLRTLDPRKYYFEGAIGNIRSVQYQGGGKSAAIPYANGIHLVNESDLAFDSPYGVSLCETAYRYWELEQLVWGCIAVAAQRQATPILALKTDSQAFTPLLGGDGLPVRDLETGQDIQIPLRTAAMQTLEQVGNSGAMVLDRLDDLIAVNQQTDGKFFQDLINSLRQARLESFLTPPTVVGMSNSGVGDSNLNQGHTQFFESMCRAKAKYVGEILIEQWVRPLLQWNHGELDHYGCFPVHQPRDGEAIALLGAISGAVRDGVFTATDEAVLMRAKSLAGIN
jgi:hypothetical protein